ncbi:MAG: putative PEP-binding protein, partial [Candidatus Omnitrophota bacterium]
NPGFIKAGEVINLKGLNLPISVKNALAGIKAVGEGSAVTVTPAAAGIGTTAVQTTPGLGTTAVAETAGTVAATMPTATAAQSAAMPGFLAGIWNWMWLHPLATIAIIAITGLIVIRVYEWWKVKRIHKALDNKQQEDKAGETEDTVLNQDLQTTQHKLEALISELEQAKKELAKIEKETEKSARAYGEAKAALEKAEGRLNDPKNKITAKIANVRYNRAVKKAEKLSNRHQENQLALEKAKEKITQLGVEYENLIAQIEDLKKNKNTKPEQAEAEEAVDSKRFAEQERQAIEAEINFDGLEDVESINNRRLELIEMVNASRLLTIEDLDSLRAELLKEINDAADKAIKAIPVVLDNDLSAESVEVEPDLPVEKEDSSDVGEQEKGDSNIDDENPSLKQDLEAVEHTLEAVVLHLEQAKKKLVKIEKQTARSEIVSDRRQANLKNAKKRDDNAKEKNQNVYATEYAYKKAITKADKATERYQIAQIAKAKAKELVSRLQDKYSSLKAEQARIREIQSERGASSAVNQIIDVVDAENSRIGSLVGIIGSRQRLTIPKLGGIVRSLFNRNPANDPIVLHSGRSPPLGEAIHPLNLRLSSILSNKEPKLQTKPQISCSSVAGEDEIAAIVVNGAEPAVPHLQGMTPAGFSITAGNISSSVEYTFLFEYHRLRKLKSVQELIRRKINQADIVCIEQPNLDKYMDLWQRLSEGKATPEDVLNIIKADGELPFPDLDLILYKLLYDSKKVILGEPYLVNLNNLLEIKRYGLLGIQALQEKNLDKALENYKKQMVLFADMCKNRDQALLQDINNAGNKTANHKVLIIRGSLHHYMTRLIAGDNKVYSLFIGGQKFALYDKLLQEIIRQHIEGKEYIKIEKLFLVRAMLTSIMFNSMDEYQRVNIDFDKLNAVALGCNMQELTELFMAFGNRSIWRMLEKKGKYSSEYSLVSQVPDILTVSSSPLEPVVSYEPAVLGACVATRAGIFASSPSFAEILGIPTALAAGMFVLGETAGISVPGKETYYYGNPFYGDVNIGTAVKLDDSVRPDQMYMGPQDDIEAERRKLSGITNKVLNILNKSDHTLISEEGAKVIDVSKLFLEGFKQKAEAIIGESELIEGQAEAPANLSVKKGKLSAIGAVKTIFDNEIRKIEQARDAGQADKKILASKAEFVGDLVIILAALKNPELLQDMGSEKNHAVIFMQEMTPAVIAFMVNLYKSCTFCPEKGTQSAHAAILAREAQACVLPGAHLTGALGETAFKNIKGSEKVIVDVEQGVLIVNPTNKTEKAYIEYNRSFQNVLLQAQREKFKPAETNEPKPEQRIKIPMAVNLDRRKDTLKSIQEILDGGLEGYGLIRAEFYFEDCLNADAEVIAEILYQLLLECNNRSKDYPDREKISIILRLPDKDKYNVKMPSVRTDSELEGIEWLLNTQEGRGILSRFLRAIGIVEYRLNAKLQEEGERNRCILVASFPQVNNVDQVIILGYFIEQIKLDLSHLPEVKSGIEFLDTFGITVETPGAIADLSEIISAFLVISDEPIYISIGTNDLTAWLVGYDRETGVLQHTYLLYDSVLRAIIAVCKIASRYPNVVYIGICGELVNFEAMIPLIIALLDRGYNIIPSLNLHRVRRLKYFTRNIDQKTAVKLLNKLFGERYGRNKKFPTNRVISETYSKVVKKVYRKLGVRVPKIKASSVLQPLSVKEKLLPADTYAENNSIEVIDIAKGPILKAIRGFVKMSRETLDKLSPWLENIREKKEQTENFQRIFSEIQRFENKMTGPELIERDPSISYLLNTLLYNPSGAGLPCSLSYWRESLEPYDMRNKFFTPIICACEMALEKLEEESTASLEKIISQ